MPILNDILDHKVLGREYKRGIVEGTQQEATSILRRLAEKRFGRMAPSAAQRLNTLSADAAEDLIYHLAEAASLEALLLRIPTD